MFGDILQPTHLLFILVVALLVLGPKRLPEVGRSLGKSLRDFRGAMSGIEEHTSHLFDEDPPKPDPTPSEPEGGGAPEPGEPDAVPSAPPAVRRPPAFTPAPVLTGRHEPDPSEYAD